MQSSANPLNADQGDWSNALSPTSLTVVGNDSQPVYFPSLVFKEVRKSSLAIHMFPNLDGGIAENMGQEPAKFHVKAILTNSIFPAINEKWKPGKLFPDTFVALNNLSYSPLDKTFSHPFYGNVNVQIESFDYEFNPHQGPRDGVIVEMVLVESLTYSVSTPFTSPTNAALASSAFALDAALFNVIPQLKPPGMSFGQMFSQIAALINTFAQLPQSTVAALNLSILAPLISGGFQVASSVLNTPANLYNSMAFMVQQTKNSVLGNPIQTALQEYQNTFGITTNPPGSSTFNIPGPATFNNQSNTNPPNPASPSASNNNTLSNRYDVNYDQSTIIAMQSIVAMNNTPSANVFQFINKAMTAVVALRQHFINQNNNLCSPVIENLTQFLLSLQQSQSSLSKNINTSNVSITTTSYPNNMTWYEISKYTNNNIDQLMSLNSGMIFDIWVPAFTTISYYADQ